MTAGRRAALAVVAAPLLMGAPAVRAGSSASGGTGLFDVRSAEVPGWGGLEVRVDGTAYHAEEVDGSDLRTRDVIDGGLQIDLGLGERVEVWGRFGAASVSGGAGDDAGYGVRDGRVGGKIRLGGGRLVPGLAVETSLPWGDRERGFSTGSFDPAVTALLTIHLPDSNPITGASLHANVGWRRLGDERGRGFEGRPPYFLEPVHPADVDQRIDLRLALELSGRRTTLFAELLLDQLSSDELAFMESPIFLTPGFRWSFTESLSLTAAGKITLAVDDASSTRFPPPEEVYPDWQIGLALAWSRKGAGADRDGDGVADYRDRCPGEPEDLDGVADGDGCPETDADGDGIADEEDECPESAETINGVEDADGCPEAPPADVDAPGDGSEPPAEGEGDGTPGDGTGAEPPPAG